MRKILISLMASLIVASCAHEPKTIEDIRINESYPLLGSVKPEYRVCTLKVQNVMTVVPTRTGSIPMSVYKGWSTWLCGAVDCSQLGTGAGISAYDCVPIEILQTPPANPQQ